MTLQAIPNGDGQKLEGTDTVLSRYDFLNPTYCRPYEDPEYVSSSRATSLCLMASELVTCAQLAFENDGSGIPLENRGIRTTLEVAVSVIDDLNTVCHELQRDREERQSQAAHS